MAAIAIFIYIIIVEIHTSSVNTGVDVQGSFQQLVWCQILLHVVNAIFFWNWFISCKFAFKFCTTLVPRLELIVFPSESFRDKHPESNQFFYVLN